LIGKPQFGGLAVCRETALFRAPGKMDCGVQVAAGLAAWLGCVGSGNPCVRIGEPWISSLAMCRGAALFRAPGRLTVMNS
jgi:hypothetical protein